MRREKRDEYVHRRAYELAITGVHISPITIVSALVKEGYPEAADLLNSDIIRNDLRRVCDEHCAISSADKKPSADEQIRPPKKAPASRDQERSRRGES